MIQYIDPPEINIDAIGLDIASEPLRRLAAQRSMLSGKATLTAPITFINESKEAYRSFLFLLPVYSTPDTPPTCPRAMRKPWAGATPLAMSEVMTDLDLPVDSLHLAIYDKTDAPQRKLIFETHHESPDGELVQTYSFEREVYGRIWLFEVSAHAAFVESLDPAHPARVFVIGLLASLLLTGMVGTLLLSRQRQHQVIAGQARLATIVENSSDAIIGEALDGRIITWNRAAEQMFGYTEAEILGRPWPLLVPQERLAEDEALLERVARGERGPTLETQRLQDGRLIDVTITCSLIREADNSILGAAKLMHDISDRKRAENYLRQFNANLEQQVSERTAELSRVAGLLQAVLDASSEVSIIAVDMQGEIVVFNRGAELLLGYTAAEMIGLRTLWTSTCQRKSRHARPSSAANTAAPSRGWRCSAASPTSKGRKRASGPISARTARRSRCPWSSPPSARRPVRSSATWASPRTSPNACAAAPNSTPPKPRPKAPTPPRACSWRT